MGCQISTGTGDNFREICTSDLSWTVVRMCSQWLNRERDCDDGRWYQNQVHKTSVKASDEFWPQDIDQVIELYKQQYPDDISYRQNGGRVRSPVPQEKWEQELREDLIAAREFIAHASKIDDSIDMSH